MSEQTPAVHPAIDTSQAHAELDAQTEIQAGADEAQKAALDAAAAQAAETQKAPTEDDKFAHKFAALSRREKALKQREAQTEARLREMEAKFQEMEQSYKSKYIDPDQLDKNTLKVLQDRGFTPDKLAELILNDGKMTPERLIEAQESKIMAKIQALEKQLADKESSEKEAKLTNAVQSFKSEIESFVNTNAEYELIQAQDATDLVYDTIQEYYEKTLAEDGEQGIILSHKEACDLVENYLFEEAKKVYSKANNKLSKLAQPTKPTESQPQRQSQTLSNAMAASSQVTAKSKLSDEESKAEAAKLIRWID